MDAKTEAQFIRNAFIDQPEDVLFSKEYMFKLADFIEQQAKDAELGRAAVECIDKVDRRLDPSTNRTLPCGYNSPIRRDWFSEGKFHPKECPPCEWYKFCKLRAEGVGKP